MKPVAWTDGKFCLSFAESDVCPIPLYTAPNLDVATVRDVDGKIIAITLIDDEHSVKDVLWQSPRELSDEDVVIPRELAENYLKITEVPRYKRILEDALKKASDK
jgi:hypothetical protein